MLVYFAAIVPSSLVVAICLVVIVEYTYSKKKAVVYPSAHKSTRVSLYSMMRRTRGRGRRDRKREYNLIALLHTGSLIALDSRDMHKIPFSTNTIGCINTILSPIKLRFTIDAMCIDEASEYKQKNGMDMELFVTYTNKTTQKPSDKEFDVTNDFMTR